MMGCIHLMAIHIYGVMENYMRKLITILDIGTEHFILLNMIYNCWRPIKKKKNKKSSSKCHRCGRNGHYKSTCYAKKHVKGFYLK